MPREYRKGRRDVLQIRLTTEEKERWAKTAAYNGYDSMADMIRDLVEGLNAKRVSDEIMDEIRDVEVGDAIIW